MTVKPTYAELEKRVRQLEKIESERNGKPAAHNHKNNIPDGRPTEDELRRYEWIIEKEMPWAGAKDSHFESAYGDVTEYNRKRLILDGVKKENLEQMAADVMALLDTSLAVYEANGDYAYGIFKSSWCQNLDTASFRLCGMNDVKKALTCGKWLCHDNCWNDSAKAAIHSKKPVDIKCVGGIRLYAVPVFAGKEIIGVVSIGYGNPPRDAETLLELSKKYNISFDLLCAKANAYKPRPEFIIELGKKRCQHMARMIGEIIESRQANENLRKSEARHSKMVANIGDVIVIIDQKGINRYKSPNIENLFGWKPEEVVGESTWDNIHPDDIQSTRTFFEKMMNKPGAVSTIECRYRSKDGSYRWIEFTGTNLFHDPDIQGLLGNYHDITERKRIEKDLRESETRFKALHNASFGGIAIHDKGVILECNQGLSEMTGYSVDELIGMDGLLLIAEKSRPAVMDNILSGYEKPYEAMGLRKNREEFPMRLEARNVPYKGKQVRTVEFRDITDVKQAELEKEKLQAQLLQAQKMESVGRLAGGVAHDFNNMLGVILGHAELALERAQENNDIYSDLKEIQRAAQRSADLTRQLLTFARKQIISPRKQNLNSTVKTMLTMLQRLIGEDIDLLWKPSKNLWPVKMDTSQIDQILANLCVNARDAIADVGKITIETGMVSLDQEYCAEHAGFIPGDFVILAVSDNGCGMNKDTLANLFEPFFTTKEMGKGTGLGLATIYGIVKQNNGFINVYSEPGQGSTFKIYLPRLVADEDIQKTAPEKKLTPGGQETILVVEDEPAILRLTRMMLERKGYSVLSAGTPAEAIEMAKNHTDRIDLLITDVVMPEMNGRDLSGKIMDLYPDVRLLFMSGYTANVIAHQGVLDDGVAFIQKPFSMTDLTEKVREVLDAGSDKNQTR